MHGAARLNKLLLPTSIMVLLCFVGVSYAARGVVVYKKSCCDYYIVESDSGYALLEWYGGNDPDEGDELAGVLTRDLVPPDCRHRWG